MTGQNAEECLLSKNLSRWATAVQHFWFDKCGEDFSKVKNHMGKLPEIVAKPVVKAKLGDLRQMALPGGGDVCTRVWASMKVKVDSLRKWMKKGAYDTAAAKDAINRLEQFMVGEGQLFEHVWKDVEPKLALRIQVEIEFLIDSCMKKDLRHNRDCETHGRHDRQGDEQRQGQGKRSI